MLQVIAVAVPFAMASAESLDSATADTGVSEHFSVTGGVTWTNPLLYGNTYQISPYAGAVQTSSAGQVQSQASSVSSQKPATNGHHNPPPPAVRPPRPAAPAVPAKPSVSHPVHAPAAPVRTQAEKKAQVTKIVKRAAQRAQERRKLRSQMRRSAKQNRAKVSSNVSMFISGGAGTFYSFHTLSAPSITTDALCSNGFCEASVNLTASLLEQAAAAGQGISVRIMLGVMGLAALIQLRRHRKLHSALRTAGFLLGAGCVLGAVAGPSVTATLIGIADAASSPSETVYVGYLLDRDGRPLTLSHAIRFSYWRSVDFVSTDRTVGGGIQTSAANYLAWNETHIITPDARGYFSVKLGSINAMPDMATLPRETLLSMFLQVEVKPSADPDTSYELLDVDPTDGTRDRSPVLSVPFAKNADLIDGRKIGTGSGSVPLLLSGGLLPMNVVPDGTTRDSFTIDADDSAQNITLSFGQNLAKKLTYEQASSRFVFNDDVRVEGDLTVTGLINGIDITGLGGGGSVESGALIFQPAYAGASFKGDGSQNVGRLFVDHDAATKRNFYLWTSTMASLQDEDILLRVTLPRGFVGWDDNPLRIEYRSSSANNADNKLDISVFDVAGNAVTLSGATLGLASTNWQTTQIDFGNGAAWSAGQDFLIKLKMHSRNNAEMQLGSLKLFMKD